MVNKIAALAAARNSGSGISSAVRQPLCGVGWWTGRELCLFLVYVVVVRDRTKRSPILFLSLLEYVLAYKESTGLYK